MACFRVHYSTASGRKRSLVVDAVDSRDALSYIESKPGLHAVDVQPLDRARPRRPAFVPVRLLLPALDSLELMLSSGVRVNAAIRAIANASPAGRVRRLWTGMAAALEQTGSFSEAARGFPKTFDSTVVGMLGAFEAAGRLAEGVGHARSYLVQRREIQQEALRGALYPSVVLAVGLLSTGVLCLYTLPRFAKMLSDVGIEHPRGFSGFVFGAAGWARLHAAASVSAVVCLLLCLLLPWLGPVRRRIDRVMLRLPLVGGACEALAMARICATYHALSTSGLRALDTLEHCARTAGNSVYEEAIARVLRAIQGNLPVGASFEHAGGFAPEFILAVRAGEGSLPSVFGRLASHYSGEARHRVATALRLLEPLMLFVVLAWVFAITLAVVMPIVEVIDAIR